MRYCLSILLLYLAACRPQSEPVEIPADRSDMAPVVDTLAPHASTIAATDSVTGEKVVAFAKTLLGTKYHFGCMAPSTGFDCSGFIYYVFHHFNIEVPRSSVDFTDKGTPVSLEQARPGDLILFTGTDPKKRVVGHIGIIVSNDANGIQFIHSSSGKEMAVVITPLNERYKERFVKVIRII